jgi:hypothetical protein
VSSVLVLVALLGVPAVTAPQAAQTPKPPTPLKVDVVLSRTQGEKKISSMPFTIWVNAGGVHQNTSILGSFVNLRMGVDVPVGTVSATRPNTSGGTTTTTTTEPNYRHVGTSIDCRAGVLDDGRFLIELRVQDSSIFDGDGRTTMKFDPAAFRTFSMGNTLSMRDGQTLLFATATDKITGEVMRVDVTIATAK